MRDDNGADVDVPFVLMGTLDQYNWEETAEVLPVKRIIVHPRYNLNGNTEFDAALLVLSTPASASAGWQFCFICPFLFEGPHPQGLRQHSGMQALNPCAPLLVCRPQARRRWPWRPQTSL